LKIEIPFFERVSIQTKIIDAPGEWAPPRITGGKVRIKSRLPDGGPSSVEIDKRIAAWTSPAAWHPEHDNDNQNWPLAKTLRTEKRIHALMLAERYRAIFDLATTDVLIVGHDKSEDIFAAGLSALHRTKLDEATGCIAYKGVAIRKAKGEGDQAPTRIAPTTEETKKAPKSIGKPFTADNAIIARMDARQELTSLRGKLGPTGAYFEMAVTESLTFEEIGNMRGISGKKGAVGAGRVLVDIGLEICARHWREEWPEQMAA
jgi:hypothetical protein